MSGELEVDRKTGAYIYNYSGKDKRIETNETFTMFAEDETGSYSKLLVTLDSTNAQEVEGLLDTYFYRILRTS